LIQCYLCKVVHSPVVASSNPLAQSDLQHFCRLSIDSWYKDGNGEEELDPEGLVISGIVTSGDFNVRQEVSFLVDLHVLIDTSAVVLPLANKFFQQVFLGPLGDSGRYVTVQLSSLHLGSISLTSVPKGFPVTTRICAARSRKDDWAWVVSFLLNRRSRQGCYLLAYNKLPCSEAILTFPLAAQRSLSWVTPMAWWEFSADILLISHPGR
jgi:hypothetical protein